MRRFAVYAAWVAVAWFLLHLIAVFWFGLHDDLQKADVAVVLGNQVRRSGAPSARLRERLDRALEVYRQGLAPKIIVSGGLGREGFAEAEVMRDYLLAHGVPADAVIVDNDGVDTYRTALNARRIMAGQGMNSAIVISQYYHIPRTRLAFVRAGVRTVYTARAVFRPSWREPYTLLREFIAYYYYLVRPF